MKNRIFQFGFSNGFEADESEADVKVYYVDDHFEMISSNWLEEIRFRKDTFEDIVERFARNYSTIKK